MGDLHWGILVGCKETGSASLQLRGPVLDQHLMQPRLSPLQMQGIRGHVHHSTWPTVGVLSGLRVHLNAVTN